jgi:hypothetical protein
MYSNLSNIHRSDIVDGVEIRHAGHEDEHALEHLRQLDSSPALAGTALVAEADGELVAAIELASGRVIADPFRRTVEITELLRVRAAQLVVAVDSRPRPRLARRARVAYP